jgi:hypothetical protein
MLNLKFVASFMERDVDLVLVEEFAVNDEFREFFSSRAYGMPILAKSLGAWHSVSDPALGESDVVHLFQSEEGKNVALLVENKIDAPPQAKQAERYRKRGEKGITEGLWEEFRTCLVAPEQYLAAAAEADLYDCIISYEELMSFFVSRRRRDPRFLYKAQVIREAIQKRRTGYQPIISPEMTKFVEEYVALATKEVPSLHVLPAKPRPAGSTWVTFKPHDYARYASLSHQLTGGYVKLFLTDAAKDIDQWQARFSPFLEEGMLLDLAGKSVGLSLPVPKLDPLGRSVADQISEVRAGLAAAKRIDAVYRKAMTAPAKS